MVESEDVRLIVLCFFVSNHSSYFDYASIDLIFKQRKAYMFFIEERNAFWVINKFLH